MQSDVDRQAEITEIAARPVEGVHPAEPETEAVEEGAPEHVHYPASSIWPITTAGGVALAGLGLATEFPVTLGSGPAWPLSLAGLLVMIFGVVGWVQELRHERHH
jgi:hypothetical protein